MAASRESYGRAGCCKIPEYHRLPHLAKTEMEKSEPVPDKAKGSEDKPADDVEDTSKEEEVPAEDDSKEDKEVPGRDASRVVWIQCLITCYFSPAPAKGKEDTEQAANEPPANNR